MVATDFGGVLHWTQHLAAIAVLVAFVVAVLGHAISCNTSTSPPITLRSMAPAGLLVLLGLYGWFQTIPVSPTLVRWLSPASYDAYMLWAAPLMRDTDITQSFPVSIAPLDSRHAFCMLVSAMMLAWIAPVIFHTRDRLTFLLISVAIGSSVTALIGICRQMFPGFQLWSFTSGGEGSPFGTFLNRNNAALLMNLGLGCSLGIVVWRLRSAQGFSAQGSSAPGSSAPGSSAPGSSAPGSSARGGSAQGGSARGSTARGSTARVSTARGFTENSAERFPQGRKTLRPPVRPSNASRESLSAIYSTPISLIAILCAVICLLGITVCGSRGGILSLAIAGLAALLLIRSGRKIALAITLIAAIVGVGVLLALPGEISNTPLDQLESSVSDNGSRMTGDARLTHWPDGLRTFLRHFPAGSGLSSYSFAYLPYQETSSWRWFHHADNLWLEMLVELGLPGIVLWIGFWTAVVIALRRLAHSHDPVDEGLRIAGWYCTAAILVSQTFDFGLILPANLFVVAMILPAIVGRSTSVFYATKPRTASPPRKPDNSKGSKDTGAPERKVALASQQPANKLAARTPLRIIGPLSCSIALLLVGIIAVNQLRRDARAEHLSRTAWIEFEDLKNSLPEITERADGLEQQLAIHPTPDLMNVASRYRFQQGRLIEIQSRRPDSAEAIKDLYRATSRTTRRLAWRASDDSVPLAQTKPNVAIPPLPFDSETHPANAAYRKSLALSERLMQIRPLSLNARTNQMYLEFLHQDPKRTKSANAQAQSLYRNDPSILLSLAAISADNQETRDAIQTWYRILLLRPQWTTRVINGASRYPRVRTADFVPNTPLNNQLAKEYLARNDKMRAQFGNEARLEPTR